MKLNCIKLYIDIFFKSIFIFNILKIVKVVSSLLQESYYFKNLDLVVILWILQSV